MFCAIHCISRLDTCEILYANDAFQRAFGSCIGQKSYAVISEKKEFEQLYRDVKLSADDGCRVDISEYVEGSGKKYLVSTLIPWNGELARYDMIVSHGLDAVMAMERIGDGMEKNDVVVKCFGSLEIITAKGALTATDFASPQCCMMLVYLLCNRHRDVSIQELGEVLWPSQQVASPYNMIKNIVLRTRRVLERVCDEPFIVINNGIYGVNPELRIVMETEAFETLYLRAKAKKLEAQQREELCEEAMALYGGTLFPTMADEPWLSARSAYYQLLYIDCVLTCMKLQESRGDRLAMYRTATSSVKNVFHDATIQFTLAMSELRAGNATQARALYMNSETMFTDAQRKQYQTALEKHAAKN